MNFKKTLCTLFAFIFFFGIISTLPKSVDAASWSDNLIFHAPFTDPTNPLQVNVGTGQFTYKRTSAATYIYPGTDIVTMSAENTIPQSEDLSTTWSASSTSVVVNQVTAPDGTASADELVVGTAGDGSRTHFITIAGTSSSQINASTNQAFTVSAYVKQNTNTWVTVALVGRNGTVNQCYFNTTNGAIGTCSANTIGTATSSTNGFYRFSVSASLGSGSATVSARVYLANGDNVSTWTGDGVKSVYVWGAQMNSGPILTPYVKTTLDIVSVPRIESAGYLVEGTRQNLILYSRDMGNAAWTKTNTTASLTAVGHDGLSNAATVLTATASNGTVCQAVTTTATSSGSVDIKRISGTGTVSISMDGGSTYLSDVSGSLSTSVWYRAVAENNGITNPSLCIKLGTSGDSVALDYAQVEINGPGNTQPAGAAFVSSRIPTVSTTNTRYIDKLSVPSTGNWPVTEGSFFVIGDVWDTATANKFFADGMDGSSRVLLHVRSGQGNGSAGILGRTTTYDGAAECSYSSVNVQPQTSTKMATRWSATSGQRGSTASGAAPANCSFDGGMEITGPIVLGDAHLQDGTRSTWGHMKDFRIYNAAFSDSMIQAATAGSLNSIGSTPNAPASVTVATTSSSSASLIWAVPTSDGGSAISDYLIQYKIGAGATSTWAHTATSATSTTITGLTSATGYTFYISAINESGTGTPAIGFGTTTSGVAPDTTAPVISSVSSSTTQTGATITWSTDESASSSIQYGLTTSYGTFASSSATSSHSVSLSGLTAGTLYNFKVTAIDASGNVSSSTNYTFTTAALPVTPPTVTQQSATSVSTSSATLNGTITNNNNASSTIRGFEYGLTTSYGTVASTTGTFNTGAYTQNISGLTPNTLYHYRAYATNSGGTGTSTDGTFTTSVLPDTTAPVVTLTSSSTSSTTATILWTTNEAATSTVQYGLTTGYGSQATSSATSSHSVVITGLTPSTVYNFKITAIDASGNIGTSTNYTFTTVTPADTTPPTISSIASSTSQTTATVSFTTNEAATSTVQYGLTTGYGSIASSSVSTTTSSYTLTGLTAGTVYHFKISASDAAGNIATSTDLVFTTTALSVTPPTVTAQSASSVSTSTVTLNGTIVSNNNASSTIRGFEYGLTISYGTTASSSGTFNIGAYTQNISGLTPNTLYHYRAYATNSSGTGTSTDGTFTTSIIPDTTAPIISSVASSTATTSITLTWTTNEAATSTVQYGLTTGYGSQATSSATSTHSVTLTGLTSGTTYNFKITAIDISGNVATSSNIAIATVVYVDTTAPVFDTFTATVSSSSSIVSWNTDENSSSQLVFGLTSAYGSTTSVIDTSPRVTAHTITLNALASCTKYFYKVISTDGSSNTATSSEQTFITSGCTSNAVVENVEVQSITTSSGGTVVLSAGSASASLVFPSNITGTSSSYVIQAKIIDDVAVISQTNSSALVGLSVVPNHVYDFKAYTGFGTTLTTFSLPVTITLNYSTSDIAGLIESTLKIYTYDGTTWSMLSNCSIDTIQKQVSCTTDHFSVFGLFASPSPVTASAVTQGSVTYGGTVDPRFVTSTNVVVPNVPTVKKVVLTKNLSIGTTHVEVVTVQKVLNKMGIYVASKGAGSPGKEIAYFGVGTKAAVIKFQKKYKIPTTGTVGPLTRAKLIEVSK